MKVKLVTASLFTCAVVAFSGCGPSGSSTKMQVESESCILNQAVYNDKGVKQCLPNTTAGVPGIRVSGGWQQDDTGATGNVLTFGAAIYGNSIVTTNKLLTLLAGALQWPP